MNAITEKYCSHCRQLKPIGDFYHIKNGAYQHICKSCNKAYTTERRKLLGEKYLVKERERSKRYYRKPGVKEHKNEMRRIRRAKERVPRQQRPDLKAMREVYLQFSQREAAEKMGCSPSTIRYWARKMGWRKDERVCLTCWLYPCFSGIESMSSNLAETCKSYHLRE